jgi:PAS domain-containing protein
MNRKSKSRSVAPPEDPAVADKPRLARAAEGCDLPARKSIASDGLLSRILDIADDAIISYDLRQRIELYNQGAEKTFG